MSRADRFNVVAGYLHSILNKNTVVTEQNRSLLVEALRSISEILIWGDQNDASVFDFFLEKNMLGFFLKIMKQKCGSYVCVQLLQTLNILFENISSETSLYYLLSNNNVNSIITHRFDFSDEEILAYYISFLKTLSFKLNPNTVHFFFNEHTNDFPLYTEAIKFFNHSESMVRIAVRTLTLNVFKVNDSAMLAFIRDKTGAPYFSNLVWFIGNHVVEIDCSVQKTFSAHEKGHDKMSSLIAEHLDHIHYTGDILNLGILQLSELLTDHLLNRLFIPLYLGSLVPETPGDGPRISPASALFFISQVFLIITHIPLVERLACILFFGDQSLLANEDFTFRVGQSLFYTKDNVAFRSCAVPSKMHENNRTDEEKLQHAMHAANLTDSNSSENIGIMKPWFSALIDALDCSLSDYAGFFSLCVLYGVSQNEGISRALLECAQHSSNAANFGNNAMYTNLLIEKLVSIFPKTVEQESKVRIVTLELCCLVLKKFLPSPNSGIRPKLSDELLARIISSKESALSQLSKCFSREDIFLDLFDDEYQQVKERQLKINFLSSDADMLNCPVSTPLSGVDFEKRLPCGPLEYTRRAIRIFLILKKFLSHVSGEENVTDFSELYPSETVQLNDCLNLTNSDMLACTKVSDNDGQTRKVHRFLVTDGLQLLLVEPDAKKVGWGLVRFVGLLQNTDVTGDKEDSRSLFVVVHGKNSKIKAGSAPALSSKLIFDDHIRCMAAKQRLTKGRQKARQYKMELIRQILELNTQSTDSSRATTPLPPLLKPAGSRSVPGHAILASQNQTGSDEQKFSPEIGPTTAPSSARPPAVEEDPLGGLAPAAPPSTLKRAIENPAKLRLQQQHPNSRRVRVLSCDRLKNQYSADLNSISSNQRQCSDSRQNLDSVQANETVDNEMGGVGEKTVVRRANSLSPRYIVAVPSSTSVTAVCFSKTDRRYSSGGSQKPESDEIMQICVDQSKQRVEQFQIMENDETANQKAAPSIQCFVGPKKSKRFAIFDV